MYEEFIDDMWRTNIPETPVTYAPKKYFKQLIKSLTYKISESLQPPDSLNLDDFYYGDDITALVDNTGVLNSTYDDRWLYDLLRARNRGELSRE